LPESDSRESICLQAQRYTRMHCGRKRGAHADALPASVKSGRESATIGRVSAHEVVVPGGGPVGLEAATNPAHSRCGSVVGQQDFPGGRMDGAHLNPAVESSADTPEASMLRRCNAGDGIISQLAVGGEAVAVDSVPSPGFPGDTVPLYDSGCVIINDLMETRIAGVCAPGCVRHYSDCQVITAAGGGATAALWARRYVSSL
jgi:thioredoxin reductase